MACEKNPGTLIAALAAVFICAVGPGAVASGWESWTSFKDVRRMRLIDDTVWMATSGGILAVVDPAVPGVEYTNIDGLATTDITDIIVDAEGQKWVTGFGQLIKFGGPDARRYPTGPVYGQIELNCVVDDSNTLWLGSDSGLVEFSKTGPGDGLYLDRFGITLINSFPVVYDICLQDTLIWLATSSGLTVTDRSSRIGMKNPSNWTLFDINSNPELNTNIVKRVTVFEDSVHLLTDTELFRMSIGPADTSFVPIAIGVVVPYDMRNEGATLTVYHSDGFVGIQDGSVVSGTAVDPGVVTGLNTGSARWIAKSDSEGLFENSSGSFEEYPYSGLPSVAVSDLVIDGEGTMTAGFRSKRSATYDFQTGLWESHPYWPPSITTVLLSGAHGDAWIGTLGGGVWRVLGDSLINFNDSNSTIVGNNDNPPGSYLYAWVTGLDRHDQYLYASVFRAYNGYPVAIATLDNTGFPVSWDSLGSDDGITDIDLVSIDYHDNVLGIGSANSGVFYCYIGPDPSDKSDDFCENFRTDNSALPSNLVRAVKFSPDGELWAATNFGISRLDEGLGQVGEIGRWVDVNLPSGLGPDIIAIEFDSRGNAWIGARNGLTRVPPTSDQTGAYTTLNSGLVYDEITSLTFDTLSGDLFVVTPRGMSRRLSTTGRLTANLSSVLARPNPFVIRSSGDRLGFGYARKATVSIFSAAGELVWEVTELSDLSEPIWDGRNQQGRAVASGVYLFVIKDADGNAATGKFLLVR
ncbi:MAG: hypothetical protein JSU65_01255 [Candidatus Zixiibacteriota bacterium]|nr:MAG: hypothetical protein JSU65_01255 [candidate division Zixibacteria bacterium]